MSNSVNPSEHSRGENLSGDQPPDRVHDGGRPLTVVIDELAQQLCDQPPNHWTPLDLRMILHATVKSLEEGVEREVLDTEEKVRDSFQRCVLTASAFRKDAPN